MEQHPRPNKLEYLQVEAVQQFLFPVEHVELHFRARRLRR